MKIKVVKIGRVAYPELRTLASMYETRLAGAVAGVELKDDAAAARALTKPAGTKIVLLDEHGKEFTSVEFAKKLTAWTDDPGVKELVFVIGGPMGLPAEVRGMADLTWALSKATFTSDMAWLLCWEQLYRAVSINRGTGYHHE